MAYNQDNYYRPSMLGGFQFFPPVIKSLMIANGIVFVFSFLAEQFRIGDINLRIVLEHYFGLMPLGHGFFLWQLITYQFLHADFWHIFFNMVFGLWMFGMEVEHVWGSRKFFIYYLTCGIVAGLAQLLLAPIFEPTLGPVIGASGAVYGVMVAFATMFPDRYVYLYFLIPIKVKYLIVFVIGFGVLSVGGGGNVANLAHLGGAVAGYIYIMIDRRWNSRSRTASAFQSWTTPSSWSKPSSSGGEVMDAKVFDINESKTFEPKDKPDEMQQRIDAILDKISQSGYQSLTEEEKKILFDASKRMN
jgi:membrane associated rhomboid family serine protease